MSEQAPKADLIRIECRQWLEAIALISGMVILTLLAISDKIPGWIAANFIEGIILGGEAVAAFRIYESAKTPGQSQTANVGLRGISENIETRQLIEVVVLIVGLFLLGVLIYFNKVDGEHVSYLIEIAILAFCGVSVGRIIADRKGLINGNAVVKAVGDFSAGRDVELPSSPAVATANNQESAGVKHS